jgi:UDP-GlcNAc:undecaprenyl-phosphate GlcNAc-1-phosphate transferase
MSGAPDEIRLAGAFTLGLVVTLIATPFARKLAIRTHFYDHPVGFKAHRSPTPYLGGAAVMAGFIIASAPFGLIGDFTRLTVCAVVLLAIGVVDDRVGLGIMPRLIAQAGAAGLLWVVDLGWAILPSDAANLALTVLWVVGLTNAFNLMDNIDGAAGTVAAVCAAGVAALALLQGQVPLATLALAVSGACAGFLPYNLARPSRIFLGDGGSMPLGLLVAGLIMAVPDGALDWATLLASAPLVGLPILDTTLVVVSRYRRRATILSGARDHVTHRLLGVLRSEGRVALALAIAQGALCGLAIGLHQLDQAGVIAGAVAYLAVGLAVLALLEAPRWAQAPEGHSA